MEQSVEAFCKLCSNITNGGDFKAIKEITGEVLDILLLKLSAQEKSILVKCNACRTKLFAAFNFKAVCMDTEDCILPYVRSKSGVPVDLREVYLKERGKEHLKGILEDESICRLCMQIVTCEFTSVKEVDTDMLRKYIPEVNFNSTKGPVICKLCLNALDIHTNFLKNVLNMRKEVNNICDTGVTENLTSIKCEDIEIKSEENYSDTPSRKRNGHPGNDTSVSKEKGHGSKNKYCGFNCRDSKSQVYKWESCDYECDEFENFAHQRKRNNIPEKQMYSCDVCSYRTKRKDWFTRHELKHKYISEQQIYKCYSCEYKSIYKNKMGLHQLKHKKHKYKCALCDFKTANKYYLTQHVQRHKDISECQIYKCDLCSYKSISKRYLNIHQRKHEKHRYKCDSCDFKTIYKNSLTQHQQKHKDVSEKQMYKCDSCDYKTIYKYSLTHHQQKHKDDSEKQMYKCDSCDYKTIYKNTLTRHQQKHKDVSEKQMHKCDSCDYKTIYKYILTQHLQKHKDVSERQMYKCESCDYKSIFKSNLHNHQLKHEKHRYKCDSCDFKTVYKYNFTQHQQKHKNISERQMYKCDSCDYKSIFKSNLNNLQLIRTILQDISRHNDIPKEQMSQGDQFY